MDIDAIPAAGYDRLELLQVADVVAREKSIEREEVLEAMEEAIQKAASSKYGQEHDVRAQIDRKSGDIRLARYLEVVDEIANEITQVTVDQAQKRKPGAVAGDFIVDALPPIDFGRIAAQTAKQVIVQKVREAERQRQYAEYKDRVAEVVNGIVKRVEFGNVTVDLGRAEAVLRRDEMIPRESFKPGDRVRAYIYDVREELRGPQIFLSRSHPQFMAKLFGQEVPEIYDSIIEIRSRATRAAAPKSPCCPMIQALIRSAPASACVAAAFRPWSANCRAKKSISFNGLSIPRHLLSTPWRRLKSPRSCWMKNRTKSRWACPMNSLAWRSAGVARTSGLLPS